MLTRITLHLARTPERPEGDARDGYEITAPLDAEGKLDAAAWQAERERCRVRRFEPDGSQSHGWLKRRAGGADGASWFIDYNDATSDDDESGFRLDRHRFLLGEYISIREEDEAFKPYRIVSLQPVKAG